MGELERLQRDAGAARGEYDNAVHERDKVADDIADTQNKLTDAGKNREKAEHELADTASEVYKSGDGELDSLLGLLFGGGASNLADRLGAAGRLLSERKAAVSEASDAERKLNEDLDKRRSRLQEYQDATDRLETLKNEAERAETAPQDYLDSLDTTVREEIDAQQAELDKAAEERKDELLAQNTEAEETAPVQNTAEKLAELREVEEQSEQKVADIAIEAGLAAGKEGGETEEQQAAERAATEAAERAAAAEKARRAAEQSAVSNLARGQAAAKAAERLAEQPLKISDADGMIDAGDKILVEGEFSIKPGATVTFQDRDGTKGDVIDGLNGRVVKGSIDTTFTEEPMNVTGGDGVLGTEGLEVVNTTGIDSGLGEPIPGQEPTGTGGLQGDPMTGTAGLQNDPKTGTAGLQPEAALGAGGTQQGGTQQEPGTSKISGLQPGPAASGAAGLQPASSSQDAANSAPAGSVIEEGLKYIGRPYVPGAPGPEAFDCSSFTSYVYRKFGKVLPDSPAGQMAMGRPVPVGTSGALLFWDESGRGGTPTHVGLDMGDGNVLHASSFAGKVTITPISNIPGLLGARMV